MTMLRLDNVHSYYGNIHALKGISINVDQGEVVPLIGSNGAGKTTTLRTISGLMHPREGTIELHGKSIEKTPPHDITRLGVVQSPEGRRVFPRMTVLENLEMGAFAHGKPDAQELDRVYGLFPRLQERQSQKAGTLSGGEQQMLAMGRALMGKPEILLLDEPSMGLSPILVETIFGIIREINGRGITVLLVEQNALMALSVANRGYVLQTGEIVLSDTADNLRKDESVRKAYLGE
ncbi:MAG: ABC transporter ATP-binding protein [Chloroflexia bacterium]|nr:ABC transporter ATP-binding protein [Chloroflexia bacterium]